MSFDSAAYLVFLAGVFLLSLVIPSRWRWTLLLAASIAFYAAAGAPLLLVALTAVTVTTYIGGRVLAGRAGTRGTLFWLFVLFDLLTLISMRYVPIWASWPHVIVAVGVSYYVFQAISYLIDVYAGIAEPERHFGYFALYLAFFPKLLQGPIERAGDLLPQLRAPKAFNYENVRAGLLLFAWGLFKKVVIADRLAIYVDPVYKNVQQHGSVTIVLATYFYAAQLYYDFSGYTDMARGAGRLFGIELTENFRAPYLATSIADFWRRWHISFSRWILDYIFKPLQMLFRRSGSAGTAVALLITFLACGAWHGLAWNFIVWGLLHGIYMAASVLTAHWRKRLPTLPRWWHIAVTFNLVSFAWIFFRANNLSDALYVVSHLFTGTAGVREFLLGPGKRELLIVITAIAVVAIGSSPDREAIAGPQFRDRPLAVRWASYYALTAALLLLAADGAGHFLYFQF